MPTFSISFKVSSEAWILRNILMEEHDLTYLPFHQCVGG
jgi:hypothetical protein